MAAVGQMGFFGGINEGKRLPKTTEVILASSSPAKKTENITTTYKEIVFLSGKPVEFEGSLNMRTTGSVTDTDNSGTYRVTYDIKSNAATVPEGAADIKRNVVFTVNWRRDGKQIVKDYEVHSWRETITAGEGTFTIDPAQSHFGVSILEDITPGVTYYKGDVSMRAVYTSGEDKVILETSGSLYGYDCVWSNTETYRLDSQIYAKDWQMQYQVRPSVSVGKTLQFSSNEPTAISFDGNYREVMSNTSGLQYTIFNMPIKFYGNPTEGGTSISKYNSFEQLIAPDTAFLKGHGAEADINKLFAMGILDGDPKYYQPAQAVTRGQFITMLVKSVKLPVELPAANNTARNKKKVEVSVVFPDVSPDRADYPYIMAAYKAGLAVGRGNGHFYVDYAMEREEALVILMRTLGLGNLGPDPTPVTPFVDDANVSSWAKKDLYAAYKLGLIKPDADGNINPKKIISKAEAAALVNLMIDYMRSGLQKDYSEGIVNFAN